MKTILAIDFDKHAASTYAANFPDTKVLNRHVEDCISILPYADIVMGGPPCQDFSLAGKRLGDKGERNGIPDFIAAVRKVKPRHFLMENVDGLLSFADGKYAAKIFKEMTTAGYAVEVKTLDAVNFGVPQFRSRCWWWGIRADLFAAGMRHQWPAPTHCWPPQAEGLFGEHALKAGVTAGQALGIDGSMHKRRGASQIRRDHPTNEPHPTIEVGVERKFHFYDHGLADPRSPCPKIKAGANTDASGHQGGGCPPAIIERVIGGGTNPKFPGDARTERDITAEPCTTIPCDAGNAIPYRWSAAMLAKHPPASPASPVLAKWYKGGAEGLVIVGDGGKMPSLVQDACKSRHQNSTDPVPSRLARSGQATGPVVFGESDESLCSESKSIEALRPMWIAIGAKAFSQWAARMLKEICGKEILQPDVHVAELHRATTIQQGDANILQPVLCGGEEDLPARAMRDLWEARKDRCSSSQPKFLRQLSRELAAPMQEMPPEGTPKNREAEEAKTGGVENNAGDDGHGMSAANMHVLSADGRTWDSRHAPALPAPTVRARSPRDGGRCTENVVKEGLMVRRLTPDECRILMSAPDDFRWPEKITKTAKYRILGNGQASGMTAALAAAFRKVDPESKTIISLFCGGGLGDLGLHGRFWKYEP